MSFGSLMVSRLIEFLFRKLKAFHYFTVVEVQHAFGRTTNYAIIHYKSEHVVICIVDEYLITHMYVCVCARACLGHYMPISPASSINGLFSQCALQQMQLLLLCGFNFTRSFAQIFNQHTPQTRLTSVQCCPEFSHCTASSWINCSVAAQCAAIWNAHNMQINSNSKHNSAGRTD